MGSDYYRLPSLLEVCLQALARPGLLPPTTDLLPLPAHLKVARTSLLGTHCPQDGLRRRLAKRGRLTGAELGALVHPGVRQLDLSDCRWPT